MKKFCIIMPQNFHDNVLNIFVADTFWQRFKGLIGTSFLPETEGLLLCKCNSIHMFGMSYALDIIYLDKDGVILKVVENIKPWQLSCCWKAQDTLEVKSGMVKQTGWKIGEKLKWQK